jgi:glycerophosphoryl diester phosphodiesterase
VQAPSPVRIAHAYGNTRRDIALALTANVDMLEADLWYRRGRVFIHHDRQLRPLPLLADHRMKGHRFPPWALPLPPRYYVRPDVNILTLEELISRTQGKRRLLLDVKGNDDEAYAESFARYLATAIRSANAVDHVEVCGQTWPVLRRLSVEAPEIRVRYSIERQDQWVGLNRVLENDGPQYVCIQHRFLTDDRLALLKDRGTGIYAWTVDDPAEAESLLDRGVDGIISNNLRLLAGLGAS